MRSIPYFHSTFKSKAFESGVEDFVFLFPGFFTMFSPYFFLRKKEVGDFLEELQSLALPVFLKLCFCKFSPPLCYLFPSEKVRQSGVEDFPSRSVGMWSGRIALKYWNACLVPIKSGPLRGGSCFSFFLASIFLRKKGAKRIVSP
jgi:hypothetical protein